MENDQEQLELDHIFIFSNNKGKEADGLIDFGWVEGSSRIHPGQGTVNRKFYFDNFFLEILWVINSKEIQGATTAPTRLWERSQFFKNGYSPFGLCLVNTNATDELFKKSKKYQPNYFPKGMAIDIITNDQNPKLPWTFRLPYRDKKMVHNEPINHKNDVKTLTRVTFGLPKGHREREFESHFNSSKNITFKPSTETNLTLEFDYANQDKTKHLPELNLVIKY